MDTAEATGSSLTPGIGSGKSAETSARDAPESEPKWPWKNTPEELYSAPDQNLFTEYEKKYPPDEYGDEANPNARVWRIYRDRVTPLDDDLLEGWHKTLDILLIFIGLFSAVTTALIIESYKRLQPDFGEITAKAILTLLAQGNSSVAVPQIPSVESVVITTRARWLNGLWFTSLTLALVDALFCILVKQWLVEYESKQRQPVETARQWARRHAAFRRGLDKWGVGAFISSLSICLYCALYLFICGLFLFLFELDAAISLLPIILGVLAATLHLFSTFAPMRWGDCPTTTPLVSHVRSLGVFVRYVCSSAHQRLRSSGRNAPQHQQLPPPAAYDGNHVIRGKEPLCDAAILAWMVDNLQDGKDVGVAVDAIGALDPRMHDDFSWNGYNPLQQGSVHRASSCRLSRFLPQNPQSGDINLYRQYQAAAFRTALFLQVPLEADIADEIGPRFKAFSCDVSYLAILLWAQNYNRTMVLSIRSKTLETLHQWYSAHDQSPLHVSASTLIRHQILARNPTTNAGDVNLVLCHGMLLLAQEPPFAPQYLCIAASLLNSYLMGRRAVAISGYASSCAEAAVEVASHRALIDMSHLLSDVTRTEELSLDQDNCQRVYATLLRCCSPTGKNNGWPMSLTESALSCLSSNLHGRSQLNVTTLLAAGATLKEVLRYAPGQPHFWSEMLHDILRGYLLQCSSQFTESLANMVSSVFNCLDVEGIEDHGSALRKIERHPGPGACLARTSICVLRRQPSQGDHGASTWELAMRACDGQLADAARMFVVQLAIMSHPTLASLLEPSDNLAQLLYVAAGGSHGIQLALADTSSFATLAKHGRVVSEDWWRETKAQLSNIPEEKWNGRLAQDHPTTFHELVVKVEEAGPCEYCAKFIPHIQSSLATWRQEMAAAAAAALVNSPPDSRVRHGAKSTKTTTEDLANFTATLPVLEHSADHPVRSRNRTFLGRIQGVLRRPVVDEEMRLAELPRAD